MRYRVRNSKVNSQPLKIKNLRMRKLNTKETDISRNTALVVIIEKYLISAQLRYKAIPTDIAEEEKNIKNSTYQL